MGDHLQKKHLSRSPFTNKSFGVSETTLPCLAKSTLKWWDLQLKSFHFHADLEWFSPSWTSDDISSATLWWEPKSGAFDVRFGAFDVRQATIKNASSFLWGFSWVNCLLNFMEVFMIFMSKNPGEEKQGRGCFWENKAPWQRFFVRCRFFDVGSNWTGSGKITLDTSLGSTFFDRQELLRWKTCPLIRWLQMSHKRNFRNSEKSYNKVLFQWSVFLCLILDFDSKNIDLKDASGKYKVCPFRS